MPHFTPERILSPQSRQRFLENLKNVQIPKLPKFANIPVPKATAAVLIPLCVVKGCVTLLYTVRSTQLRSHSGQISFPGGKTDNNESAIATALREAHEEIGVERKKIDIWGEGPAVPGRDFKILITPIVATLELNIDKLKLNKDEVDSVFTVPLSALSDPRTQYYTQFKNGVVLPVFVYEQYRIWGITAYLTHFLLSCLLPREVYKNDWMRVTSALRKVGGNL